MKKIIAIVGFFGFFASQMASSSAAYFNTTPLARCETKITKTLQMGSENNDVYILQSMLVNAGFLNAAPNGYFGRQTYNAVRAFQMNNGITATGIVGPSTRNAVNERLCDVDLVDNTYPSYSGYSVGTTFVSPNDPFVKIVTPTPSVPTVYTTPGSVVGQTSSHSLPSTVSVPVVTMSSPSSQIVATGIVYNPSSGYTYGVIPRSGSVTVFSPVANTLYQEGDTVTVRWTTDNIQTSLFSVSLESTITRQSKVVAVTAGNAASFTLTKELLDAICSGTCNNNQQGSFKITVSLPTTDIAGLSSTLKAAVAPISINRPLSLSQVSITPSKTPVNSGEVFRLYVNLPTNTTPWNTYGYSAGYSIKIKAVCTPGTTVSIAGTPCGQEFAMPFTTTTSQQEIPASIINTTWYKQDVTFHLTVVNLFGQTVGTGETRVTVDAAPFSW